MSSDVESEKRSKTPTPHDGSESEEDVAVIGNVQSNVGNKKPPTFKEKFWSPISYIFFLWFSGLLQLVRGVAACVSFVAEMLMREMLDDEICRDTGELCNMKIYSIRPMR